MKNGKVQEAWKLANMKSGDKKKSSELQIIKCNVLIVNNEKT